jgi:polyhydroxybutyrate depolymerase
MNKALVLGLILTCTSPALAKTVTIGPAERPAKLKLPKHYDGQKKMPLILMLHGRGNQPETADTLLGLSRAQDKHGYLLLMPKGTVRSDGQTFWNATPECCDTDNSGVDDSGYLQSLVQEAMSAYSVDENRVYIYGHSNGGFMGYRLACDTNGLFKGVVSLAGSTFADPSLCRTETPINILQVHGTDDSVVPFDTKGTDKAYPGAFETAEFWAQRNGCQTLTEKKRDEDLLLIKWELLPDENGKLKPSGSLTDFLTPGIFPETDSFIFGNCESGTRTGLWKIRGADHAPIMIGRDFVGKTLRFLEGE